MIAGAEPGRPRVLVVRPDHIGDVLLTLPAVAELRNTLPNADITCLIPPGSAEVPRHCAAVDSTLTVPFPPLDRIPFVADWRQVARREAEALRGRFDLALLPRPDDPWSGALTTEAGIPARIGFATARTLPYLTHAIPEPTGCHVADLGLMLASKASEYLSGRFTSPPSRVRGQIACGRFGPVEYGMGEASLFDVSEDEERDADRILSAIGLHEGNGLIALHPGSGWPIKNWPPCNWGTLASELHRRLGLIPLVTGNASERDLVDATVGFSGGRAVGLPGCFSLGGLAALFRRVRLVVATDSGPLHLAALTGVPVVGLYGPIDPDVFGPWCPPDRQRIVRVQLGCSPCGNLLDPPCGAQLDPACVTRIPIEAVMAAVADLLELSGAGRVKAVSDE